MKKRVLCVLLAISMLLSGCSLSMAPYVSVTPHREQRVPNQTDVIMVSNYLELLEAMGQIVATGTEVAAIIVADYPASSLEHGMERAIQHTRENDPIGAYAVENIEYELGTSSGVNAVSVSVTYRHNRSELQRIHRVEDMDSAEVEIKSALERYDSSLVIHVERYDSKDFTQFVHDYALMYPQKVMEHPQVTETLYGTGRDRVVELIFTYQTSRDALRRMQQQVQPIFNAASLYVSGDGEERQKFAQLYTFLVERFDYKLETSITPAYSLLRHGVGDSRAFATVYAAMCRSAGLECMTVTGTRSGEPWTWNIVQDAGQYFHVDLLQCNVQGGYFASTDNAMDGYVWDYSAYPVCDGRIVVDEVLTEPTETGETEPEKKVENFEN